jgi:hypothetical protein
MMSDSAEQKAWKIPAWGARYDLGRAKSYKIIQEGAGPKTITIGSVQYVTEEDDRIWRKKKRAEAPSTGRQGRGR